MPACKKLLPLFLFPFVLLNAIHSSHAYDNVLIITVDTLRADYIGCYGSNKVKTPNIDELARSGTVFKNTVAPAPLTLPSHVSLFTGLIPPVHGVQDNSGFYLDKKVVTLAKVLKAHGMSTAAFIGAFALDSRFGLDQGFDLYDDSYPAAGNLSAMNVSERKAEEVTGSALKWLEGQAKNRWFVWIHFYDPHFPYNPPDRFKSAYPADLYAGEVAYVDEQVGRILSFVRTHQLEKRTLIVLTADHGESLGEHAERTHGIFAYESTLRVPFVLAPTSSTVIQTRVRLIDIAPTILKLLKLSFPEKIQGQALVETLDVGARHASPLQDSYFEALSMYLNNRWAPLRGFYSEDYKYIRLPIPELYNLTKDPNETRNLCEDKQLCKKWSLRFSEFWEPFQQLSHPVTPIGSETVDQLRALGYVSGGSRSSIRKEFGSKDDPKNLVLLHDRAYLALSYFNNGNAPKALEMLETVIQQRPDYSEPYLIESFIQSLRGSPEKAIEILKRAIQNGVTGIEVQGKLGLYLFEAKRYEEAIEQLRSALTQDPNHLINLNYLGMAYAASSKFEEAESTFTKALTLDRSDSMTLNNLGTIYLKQKKYALAINQFQAAVTANPYLENAYSGLGVAYEGLQNWDAAIQTWETALRRNSNNLDAMLHVGLIYWERGDHEKAIPLLRNFEKNAPSDRYGSALEKVRSLLQHLDQS